MVTDRASNRISRSPGSDASSTVGVARAQARTLGVTAATAQAILAHVTGRDRAWLLAHVEAALTPEQAGRYADLLGRAAQGEPLAYLTGFREFCGLAFEVAPEVLIPRPETEMLVEAAEDWITSHQRPDARLIDVGTGSGAIAVALAVRLPAARITATDVSSAALAVARRNAARHGVADRIAFMASYLLKIVPGPYDVIVSNLPYIPSAELAELDAGRWEPLRALDGGPDGLRLIERLIAQARSRLAEGGLLALEMQFDQGQRIAALCRQAFPGAQVAIQRDLAGLDRIVTALLPPLPAGRGEGDTH
jgi:release factor glutamine methyltransferase